MKLNSILQAGIAYKGGPDYYCWVKNFFLFKRNTSKGILVGRANTSSNSCGSKYFFALGRGKKYWGTCTTVGGGPL